MNQRVHDEPIDLPKETASIALLFRYDDVSIVVDDITGQVARTASALALNATGALVDDSKMVLISNDLLRMVEIESSQLTPEVMLKNVSLKELCLYWRPTTAAGAL